MRDPRITFPFRGDGSDRRVTSTEVGSKRNSHYPLLKSWRRRDQEPLLESRNPFTRLWNRLVRSVSVGGGGGRGPVRIEDGEKARSPVVPKVPLGE